jgi:hypothetical protein
MSGEEPRTWNAINWIEIFRSTGCANRPIPPSQCQIERKRQPIGLAFPKSFHPSTDRIALPIRTIRWWSRPGSNRRPQACKARALPTELRPRNLVVGPGRVERPTSRLSGVRSNHLSYEPDFSGHSPRQSIPGRAPYPCMGVRSRNDGRKGNEGGGSIAICLVRCPEPT